jgi:hypothetical protein
MIGLRYDEWTQGRRYLGVCLRPHPTGVDRSLSSGRLTAESFTQGPLARWGCAPTAPRCAFTRHAQEAAWNCDR